MEPETATRRGPPPTSRWRRRGTAVGHLLGVAALAVGSMLVACSPDSASPMVDAPLQAGAQTTIPVDPIGISEIEAGPNNMLYLGGSGGLSTLAPGAAQPARMNLDPQPVVSSMAVAPDGTVSFVKLGGVVETLKPGATTAEPLPFDQLRHFSKIAVARDGTIYLGDNEQHKLLKLAPGKRVPTELAVGEVGGLGHMVVDGDDNLYVSMRGKVVKIANGATTAEPVAGVTDHAGGLAVDAAGNLYVTDLQANTVSRTVAPGGDWVQLPFSGLQTPADIAVDGDATVYVVNKLGTEIARLAAT